MYVKSSRLHAAMPFVVSISVVCRCIGTWGNAYSRKSSKARNAPTMERIFCRI